MPLQVSLSVRCWPESQQHKVKLPGRPPMSEMALIVKMSPTKAWKLVYII